MTESLDGPRRSVAPWLVVAAAVLCWLAVTKWLFPSDQEQILSLLDNLATLGSAAAAENPVASALVAKDISDSFVDNLRVTLRMDDELETHSVSRRELTTKIAAVRNRFASFSLAYFDPEISLDGDRAAVELTGRAVIETGDGSRSLEELRIRVDLRRTESGWRISAVENSEPLSSQRTFISPFT